MGKEPAHGQAGRTESGIPLPRQAIYRAQNQQQRLAPLRVQVAGSDRHLGQRE